MLDVALAFAAGLLTILAPCILPILPIVFGVSVGDRRSLRPLLIIIGFVVTFSSVAFVFGLFPSVLGLSPESLREAASVLLMIFGLAMIWPRLFDAMMARLGGVRPAFSTGRTEGGLGAVLLGASLGVVWAPCAGPVLGSILTLIASSKDLGRAALLLGCYAIGAALPMLLIAYGGHIVTTRVPRVVRYTHAMRRGFGAVVTVIAAAMFLEYDAVAVVWLSRFFPTLTAGGL
jgi:cytochrome c-type biogenesis protein